MLGHRHYFPILRWKRGEYIALRELQGEDRVGITPLVELVPRTQTWSGDQTARQAEMLVAEIDKSWGTSPLLIDPQHLSEQAPPGRVLSAISEAAPRQLQLVPVVGLARTDDYYSAVQSTLAVSRSVALRIQRSELSETGIAQRVSATLARLGITPERAYLIIDFSYLPQPDSMYPNLGELIHKLPRWNAWLNIVLAGGAFPPDLTSFQPGQHRHPRSDWQAWTRLINGKVAGRRPAYGDYATLHAIYSPPPAGANPSASIRYTASTDWVIMRGEGVRTPRGGGHAQWPANAQLLRERAEFCGEDYSYGDAYIARMAGQMTPTGNAETWLRAGVNHHLTFVVRQVAKLGVGEGNGEP
ncbi:beta family protein [Candidatus Palauibacter sp.]|uniref:beta family protein n=1 Tax=Candidatus Palauibacter sp. TaxID=3101350 RepID=UPI003B593462